MVFKLTYHKMLLAMLAAFPLLVTLASGQAPKLDRVIGEVTAIDANTNHITVKPDSGVPVTATVDEKTRYLRVPPGEKDLKNAAAIHFDDVSLGDRAFVRGHLSEDQKSIAAVAVIIMTKAELAKKQERDREEWKRRGTAGPVTALNAETKEITISTRTREGSKPVVVEAVGNTEFRRYAPDSVRFSDAKPSSFAELKVGDQLRVLGDKDADGTRIKAEEIVSGSFRNIAGVIKTMDASANQVTLTDLVLHKPVTVVFTPETSLRRLPPAVAAMLARRNAGGAGGQNGGGAGPGGGEVARREGTAAQGIPGPPRADSAKPGAGGAPAENAQFAGGGGMRRSNVDFQDMLERMPPIKLADLKVGDAIMLASTNGTDGTRVTAINVLAGVEPLLTAAPQGGQQIFGAWNFDIGLPE